MKNIIDDKKEIFVNHNKPAHIKFEYILTCLIIKDVVDCVNSMHNLDPPIAHKNLKPTNILVNYMNGEIVFKISDYGLDMNTYESYKYLAPEKVKKIDCGIASDIFSLGRIFMEIFDNRYNL